MVTTASRFVRERFVEVAATLLSNCTFLRFLYLIIYALFLSKNRFLSFSAYLHCSQREFTATRPSLGGTKYFVSLNVVPASYNVVIYLAGDYHVNNDCNSVGIVFNFIIFNMPFPTELCSPGQNYRHNLLLPSTTLFLLRHRTTEFVFVLSNEWDSVDDVQNSHTTIQHDGLLLRWIFVTSWFRKGPLTSWSIQPKDPQ